MNIKIVCMSSQSRVFVFTSLYCKDWNIVAYSEYFKLMLCFCWINQGNVQVILLSSSRSLVMNYKPILLNILFIELCLVKYLYLLWNAEFDAKFNWSPAGGYWPGRPVQGSQQNFTGGLRPEVKPLTLLYTSFDWKSTPFESHFVNVTNDTPFTHRKLSCLFHRYKIHLLGPSADRNDRFPYLIS